MTDRDTVPVSPVDPVSSPEPEVAFWRRRTLPPMLGDRWRTLTGPWGRFYAAIAVGLAFIWHPRTWPSLLALAVVVLVGSFGRRHWIWYAVPIGAVGVGTGSAEWAAAATGCVIFGHRWASRASRPDALAMRLHLRIAELTGAPTKERYWRLETFAEARDRLLTFLRGGKSGSKVLSPFKRIRKEEWRPLDPVPHWLRIDLNPPQAVADGAYEYAGLYIHYPASCPDDDPDWQHKLLQAAASKLPPMPDGTSPLLLGDWHTSEDWVYATVAKPLPTWVNLTDLPHLAINDSRDHTDRVVPLGLVTPGNPLGILVEGDDTTAVAVWNPASTKCKVPIAPNFILAGPPGSFKTSALRTIIHGCREHLGARLVLIDGKREGAFAYLQDEVDVLETADPGQAVAALADTHAEMLARYELNNQRRRERLPIYRFQPIVVIIDEGMSLLDQLGDHPRLNDLMFWMVDISRLGRAGNVHLGWATQRPDVRGVRGDGTVGQMRDSLELHLGGAGLSEAGGQMIYGPSNGKLVNQIPKTPRGRFGMMVGSDFTLLQLAYTPDPLGQDPDNPGPYATSARALADDPNVPNVPIGYVVQAAERDAERDQASDDTPPVASITSRRRTMTP